LPFPMQPRCMNFLDIKGEKLLHRLGLPRSPSNCKSVILATNPLIHLLFDSMKPVGGVGRGTPLTELHDEDAEALQNFFFKGMAP
jgi:hypothetical protein